MKARSLVGWAALAILLAAGAAAWILPWPLRVETARPERGPAVHAVYATGAVEPVRWAKVAPAVTGRLTEIQARDNDVVAEGQVLARLDDRDACAGLAEAEARERFQKSEADRLSALANRGVASRQAYDRAVSELEMARAAVAAARQCVVDRTMRAPLDGVVLRQDGEVGEIVTPGDIVFWIGDPRPLRITAEVDEEDIPLVDIGQAALVKADAFPERTIEGSVSEITLKGDPLAKTYRVRIGLEEAGDLMIGMTTEVNIVVREDEDALLIPVEAAAGERVWTVRDGRAEPVEVRLGVIGAEQAEVLAGLDGDETVILSPGEDLAAGRRVYNGGFVDWAVAAVDMVAFFGAGGR